MCWAIAAWPMMSCHDKGHVSLMCHTLDTVWFSREIEESGISTSKTDPKVELTWFIDLGLIVQFQVYLGQVQLV